VGESWAWLPKSIQSILFESNSHLTRIESEAFSYSSLQSIVIPRHVRFIDASAFLFVILSSISIKAVNDMFVVENGLLIDVFQHKLIQNLCRSSKIEIPNHVQIFRSKCFSSCKLLSSIIFESNSHLTRIESKAFNESSLQSILLPSTISFVASDAVDPASQILHIDSASCPEIDGWSQLRKYQELQLISDELDE
jgi:hypothetical protein